MSNKTYTVKQGDTLYSIARSVSSTVKILMDMNANVITNQNVIQVGWVLAYKTSAELSSEQKKQLSTQKQQAKNGKKEVAATRKATDPKIATILFNGQKISKVDSGTVKILSPIPALSANTSGKTTTWKVVKMMSVNETRPVKSLLELPREQSVVYKNTTYSFSELYLLPTGNYIPVVSGATEFRVKSPSVEAGLQAEDERLTPAKDTKKITPIIPATTSEFASNDSDRPSIEFTNKDNHKFILEMRIIGVSGAYSNVIQQTRTNAGWMLNLSGENLPTININGFFLDTQGQMEFDQFVEAYRLHLKAYRDGDYYSSAICTFTHQKRQYQTLIAGFSYVQESSAPHIRTFQMQLLVLHEETLPELNSAIYRLQGVNTASERAKALLVDPGFVSNLKNTLTNPNNIGVIAEE